ncbi:L,D-transpeptidase catalytic domain [Paenibacillus sp. 1_12]|uniref:L,D-transpeptidase family protein n=1 Tax=Paenibacillus sp. 1_12 TaxID=1566278 RepID=UPI0008F04BC6|nr:L,D-transpeptidase family protein [Paenibacillus sp. 1_12]SFM37735.1 L,D-transpeptidase catalytic domain [Paenibacillus sp. 1_12]
MVQIKSRFKNHLDEEMVHLHKNLYINRSDPMYFEKVIRYLDPHSPEAHYKLGQKFEEKGIKEKALFHYKECRKIYPSPYYFSSASAIRGLEGHVKGNESLSIADYPTLNKSGAALPRLWKLVLLVIVLLGVFLLGLLWQKDSISRTVSAFKLWGVGKEITYEIVDMPYIIYFPRDKPRKEIENDMYNKALELAKTNPGQNIWLYGIASTVQNPDKKTVPLTDETQKTKAFVVAQYNSAQDQTVKIRFLNAEFGKLTIAEAGANLVRTALEAYISDNGTPPEKLDKLVADYPQNYLSFIPNEIQSGSNQIVKKYDGDGGWVFDPLAKQFSDMFYPNIMEKSSSQKADFERYQVVVGKSDHSLQLLSGSTLLMEKKVGLGADDLTPEGTFTILDRVKEPQGKHPNVYGSSALGMGAIALHGTNDPASIGSNMSLGCIRMANADMDELFPFIPKGTVVFIRESIQPRVTSASAQWNPQVLIPLVTKLPNESAKNKVFHWLG